MYESEKNAEYKLLLDRYFKFIKIYYRGASVSKDQLELVLFENLWVFISEDQIIITFKEENHIDF